MDKEQPSLSGLAAAVLAVGAVLVIIGWLSYCTHFASVDSWQRRVFAGPDGALAILWLVVFLAPLFVLGVIRLRRTTSPSDFPVAVARNFGGYAVAVGMADSAFLDVSGPMADVVNGIWISGIILFAASEIVLRRRSAKGA